MTVDPAVLGDIHEITVLKYRYGRCLDNRQWEEFASTLAPDATARYGTVSQGEPLHFDGRDAIVDYMRSSLTGTVITTHTFGNPEIDVAGDAAAKLRGALARLRGRGDDGAWVALYADEGSAEASQAALTAFAEANLGPLQELLRRTRDAR